MTFPSGSSANFQVILDFLINNEEVIKRVVKETEGLTDVTKQAAAAEKVLKEESDKIAPGLYDQAKAEQQATEAAKQHSAEIRQQVKEIRAQAREIQARNRVLLDTAQDIDRMAKPLQQYGLLVVGGIFAAANKYVNSAKEATATTIAWKKAQDSLNESGMRIGAVLAEQALPLLKEAAEITSKVAGFIEKHPEIIGIALKGGLLALTLGTIGKAVSGGIRLYADFKMDAALSLQLTAAELQLQAAQTQLAASGGKSLIPQAGKAVAGSSLLGFAPLAAIGVGAAINTATGLAASNIGARAFGFDNAQDFWKQMLDKLKGVKSAADETADSLGKTQQAIQQESAASQTIRELHIQERAEQIKLMVEGRKEELKLLRDAQLEKIRVLTTSFLQESVVRRQALQAGLSETINYLKNELQLKKQAFSDFIKSIGDMFKNALNYVKSLLGFGTSSSSLGTAGGGSSSGTVTATNTGTASSTWSSLINTWSGLFGAHDDGGYVGKSIARMAWDGKPEFVMNNSSVRMAEKIVGGQLNQNNVIGAMAGGGRGQVVWNDHRRFDGEVTMAMRRAVAKDTEAAIGKFVESLG